MSKEIIDSFCELYRKLNKNNLSELENIYSEDILFIDAVHQLRGIEKLQHYFSNLYKNIRYCRFHIEEVISGKGQASIIWTMTFAHSRLNSGEPIRVNGSSHLKFAEKIYYHRDYLDMGQMLYAHLPLLGGMVKFINKRVSR